MYCLKKNVIHKDPPPKECKNQQEKGIVCNKIPKNSKYCPDCFKD